VQRGIATFCSTVADDKKPSEEKAPFRFLTHAEFAALTQEERMKYLDLATREVSRKAPSSKLFKDD
jgi:hypothetical protein